MQNAIDWEFGFATPRSAFGALQKNGSQKTNSKKFCYDARSCPTPIDSLAAPILPSRILAESDNALSLCGRAHHKKQHNHVVLI